MKTDFLAGGNNFLPFSATIFFHFPCYLKNGRKWFPPARKSVALLKIWSFFKNWLNPMLPLN